MIIEPILREPGSVSFSWLEIQRTKASLVQQIEQQTNFTANETLLEFGLYPKDGDCEHKCPELDACIASNLWCDGNCFARKFSCGFLSFVLFQAFPTARRVTTNHQVSAELPENSWNYLLGSTQLWDVWQRELQLALFSVWSALHADAKIHQSQNIRCKQPR